jgi:hypothetical protein
MYFRARRLFMNLLMIGMLVALPAGSLSADPGINPQIPFSGVASRFLVHSIWCFASTLRKREVHRCGKVFTPQRTITRLL